MDFPLWKPTVGEQPALTTARSHRERQRARWRHALLMLAAAPLLLLLLLPLAALALATPPQVLLHYLGQTGTVQAIGLSLGTSSATALLALAMGTPIAYLLAGRRGGFGKFGSTLETILDLPTVLPPAVAGLALLLAFGRRGLLGGALSTMGIQVAFTPVAVIMAQTFVAAPYYIKTAALGLAAVNGELRQAAALDGASGVQTFRYVTLPLAWRSVVGGMALCWARALGEFGATIIFAGNYPGRTQTMPLAVYLGFEIDLGQALTLAAILLVISFGLLFAIRSLLRRAPDASAAD